MPGLVVPGEIILYKKFCLKFIELLVIENLLVMNRFYNQLRIIFMKLLLK